MRYLFVFLTIFLTLGCVPAKETAPVIALQREAATALARHCAQDQAAITATTSALLDIHRTVSAARLETRAMTLLFNQSPAPTIGGLSAQPAAEWLNQYQSATSASDRRALIASLPDQQIFEQDAAAVLIAISNRGARATALLTDLLESTVLLEAYASHTSSLANTSTKELLTELYTQVLRDHFDNPDKQAAADRIAERLLGILPENPQ